MRIGAAKTLIGIVALAVLAWTLSPSPPPTAEGARQSESWQLPSVPRQSVASAADTLAKSELWGKAAETQQTSASLNDPGWRFLGIVRRGDERFVLIKVEGQPEARLAPSDKLPGGGEILEIGADSLCILINGQKRRLAIYKTGSQVL